MVAESEQSDVVRPKVRCAKCRHSNSASSNSCNHCGARLYISCRACGTGNPRSEKRCASCGHSLHRSAFARLSKRLESSRLKLSLWQILLFIVTVPIAFKVILILTSWESSAPPSE